MATNENNEKKVSLLLEDLALLEAYARDLFVFSPLPVCFVSPIGVILEVNPAFEKVSHFSLVEIVGEGLEKIFKKEEAERLIEDTLKEGFVEQREMELFPKDRKGLVCQVFTKVRKDKEEKTVGFFLSIFDLSKIKESERKLKQTQVALLNILEDTEEARRKAEEEKNKTQAIITNFVDGLLVLDKENRVSLINPQAENFFDLKAQDLIGRPISELSTFSTLEPLIRLLIGETRGVFRKEILIKENLTLEVSTVPILREKEKLGTLVILHDITREKIVERLKTEFVSLAAHQLRTPLSAIKWTLKMLLDGDLGKVTEEQRIFIEKTYRANERMIALINDLLDVTRIEEGRYLYKPILTELEPIVQFVVNSYKEEIKKKKIKFGILKPKKKLPKVLVDVERIKLAIENLLDNALRYTPEGGLVTISLKSDKNKIEFSIKDSGVGIPKDQQERVFSKFFRGTNVIRMETEGTGLGLFITKNIIEAHGGKIWFESEEDKGTTFYFTLPTK